MAALDTNVLLRYLLQDDLEQTALARRLFRKCIGAGEALYVPVSVFLEIEWVLRANFGLSKADVMDTMKLLLDAQELTFELEGAVEVALLLYQENSVDFSDCLHVALAAQAGEQPLWSFDRKAAKLVGAKLLA